MEALAAVDSSRVSNENDYSIANGALLKEERKVSSRSNAKFQSTIATRDDLINFAGNVYKRSVEKKLTKNQVRRREGHEPIGFGFIIKDSEMAIIADIINFMNSKSTVAMALPSNQKYLKDQGKKIDHLHPLCFIWTIARSDDLKAKLRSFRDNSAFALKWNGFLGYSSFHDKGFGRNMEKYYNSRDPADYQHEFDAFYRSLNIKADVLNPYIQRKDWKGFTSAIIEQSSYN